MNQIYHLADDPKSLREFILLLHTGETVLGAPVSNQKEDRRRVGQECLQRLAQDILEILTQNEEEEDKEDLDNLSQALEDGTKELIAQLELDGYIFRGGRLYPVEGSVIAEHEEQGYLEHLVDNLPLQDRDVIKHHIRLSQQAYAEGRWNDTITNARSFLEAILQQVAAALHQKIHNTSALLHK